jgi:hypothetical protein
MRVEKSFHRFRDDAVQHVLREAQSTHHHTHQAVAATQHSQQVEQAARLHLESEVAVTQKSHHAEQIHRSHLESELRKTYHAEQAARLHLESEVRHRSHVLETEIRRLATAQIQLLGVVEGLSSDREHHKATNSKAHAQAIHGVKQLHQTLSDLHNHVEKEGGSYASRMEQHTRGLHDLRTSHSDLQAKQHAQATSIGDLQRRTEGIEMQLREFVIEMQQKTQSMTEQHQHGLHEVVELTRRLESRLVSIGSEVKQDVTGVKAAVVADISDMKATAESSLQKTREELRHEIRKYNAEFQAEVRLIRKQEETSIAALDEQLSLTDQRISQRLDELSRKLAAATVLQTDIQGVNMSAVMDNRSILNSPLGEQRAIGREAATVFGSTTDRGRLTGLEQLERLRAERMQRFG